MCKQCVGVGPQGSIVCEYGGPLLTEQDLQVLHEIKSLNLEVYTELTRHIRAFTETEGDYLTYPCLPGHVLHTYHKQVLPDTSLPLK